MIAAIYNVYDGEEWLERSINSIRDHVDLVIAVSSFRSNWGEEYFGGVDECNRLKESGLIDIHEIVNPIGKNAYKKELYKRSFGLFLAKERKCTHFILMDCDELYNSDRFNNAKEYVIKNDFDASVCEIRTYFGNENLMYENLESFHVPFIHKLHNRTKLGAQTIIGKGFKGTRKQYPYYVDRTRSTNTHVMHCQLNPNDIVMHHYSWVRNDIERKINNSTAKMNGSEGLNLMLQDYHNAKEGYILKSNGQKLIQIHNINTR